MEYSRNDWFCGFKVTGYTVMVRVKSIAIQREFELYECLLLTSDDDVANNASLYSIYTWTKLSSLTRGQFKNSVWRSAEG